jgi:hypothetical protein
VVFRAKKPLNWLSYRERIEAPGVECEGGEILTEAGLSKELLLEKDNKVLDSLRGIDDLVIVVPKKGSTRARTLKALPAKLPANSFPTLEVVPGPSASKPLPTPLIAKLKA